VSFILKSLKNSERPESRFPFRKGTSISAVQVGRVNFEIIERDA